MNNQMLGADPEQLRALSKLFGESSAILDHSATALHPAIMNARWGGPDAERFRSEWASRLRPQLGTVRDLLTGTSKELVAQAREQEQTSAAHDVGGGVPGGPGSTGSEDGDPLGDDLQNELEDMPNRTAAEVLAWWNGLSKAQQDALFSGKDGNGVPNSYYLASLEDKLPPIAFQAAVAMLVASGLGSIPMYTRTDKIGVDGQVAWVHGGAHLASRITQNADGSVTLKLSGDLGGGVNTPSTKGGANATLTGELSKTYKFNSLEEALAARDQMLNDLPPDSFGKVSDAISNPGGYIHDRLDNAANDHGSTKEWMSAKGTVSVGAEGKLSSDTSVSAQVDFAYERNLSDETSSASATASFGGKLDLGEGLKFGGSGEAGITLSMDAEGDINKMTLDRKGTLEGAAKLQDNPNVAEPGLQSPGIPTEGISTESKAGIQGTAQLELFITPENQHLMESYLGNVATGNQAGAAADMQQIVHASAVTVQANSVVSNESNLVDFDSGVAKLTVGGSSEVIVNAGTAHKAPYDDSFQAIQGQDRYEPGH
ncbi:hypothetical protein ART_2127 [Arthrobacter sp. PAMC 25486]|uniref:WXG100 family type VII secretion target n=1 Tax=Arthrobacter sp. PAMC 25486 TaxID=1494608 RepID=UPI00053631D9|nr:WXG100 family type VII secretion target [Arthrobacter sp. PAMC 25486]AIY01726.1 hypothetical protein ART_2127 [Arthrobacter sp. PAMC 25486]